MLKNLDAYTASLFYADKFLEATGNMYRYVSQRPYLDKNGKAGSQGTTVTLMVIQDSMDYGTDKQGKPREDNTFETFDATILNGKTHLDLKKGDVVSLGDYDPEHSYVIKYDLVLRFKDIRKIEGAE